MLLTRYQIKHSFAKNIQLLQQTKISPSKQFIMSNDKLVLVADDSRTSRHFICFILEKAGYKTIQAENGLETIEIYKDHKPCCIILDLLMPEMDGLEVLIELKKIKSETPVIVLTADVQEEVKTECFENGAKAFINKPFKENDLIDTFLSVTKQVI